MATEGPTRVAGIIGKPVAHSLSPVLHNAAFEAMGLNWNYHVFEVAAEDVPAALGGVRALGIEGLSVTMPNKHAVAEAADEVSPEVEALGAANTIVRRGRVLRAYNTDGIGLVNALRIDEDFDPRDKEIAVMGSGGAAKAVIQAFAEAGAARVLVAGRTPKRVEMAAALAGTAGIVGTSDDLGAAHLVVNATNVGMEGFDDAEHPIDVEVLNRGQFLVDLIYHPLETTLLRQANERGVRTANGVGMLVHQAAEQIKLWTGQSAPIDVLRNALLGALAAR